MKKRGDANFFIILIILVVIILGIILFNLQNIKDYFTSKELKLSNEDKEYLLNLAYNTIVTYVNEGREYVPENIPNKFLKYNYDVNVKIVSNNVLRGTRLGTGQDLINNLINASIRASEDKRNGREVVKKEELDKLRIIITIIKKYVFLEDKSLSNIQKNINLREDGIRLRALDNRVKDFIAVIDNQRERTHQEILEGMCGVIDRRYNYPRWRKLGKDCWKNPFVNIFKLEVIEFEKNFSK